jgi:hypothetical protein
MKKSIITLLFVCFSTVLLGQINELGFFAGGTNYVGDVGSTNYIYPNNPGFGIIYKWNWNPRIALRGTYSHLPIKGNDTNADNSTRENRGYTFSNTINELAIGLEFNFFDYDLSSDGKKSTPYILLELAGFNYKTPISEEFPGKYLYTNSTSYAIPFGIGYKSYFYGKLAIAIEAKFRYTFKDDLDYTTSKISSLDFGGTGNDWYMFTGVSIVYTFGRPACYSELK